MYSHWSKTQTNVARSSWEAEVNSVVKDMSEGFGVINAMRELFSENRGMILGLGASACKRFVLRAGALLSTTQLWVRGGIQSCGAEVQKMLRAENATDTLSHAAGESKLKVDLQRIEYHTPGARMGHP